MTFQDAMTQVASFNTLAVAKSYAERASNRYIVMGDIVNEQELYWVCSARVARWLEKQGYEIID